MQGNDPKMSNISYYYTTMAGEHMRAARRQGVLGVVHCGTGPSSRARAHAPPIEHLLRGGINLAYARFKADKDIMDALVLLRKKTGTGVRGGQPAESQLWRRRCGACFTLTMPESSRNYLCS